MKRIKPVIAAILAVMMCVQATGCGGEKAAEEETTYLTEVAAIPQYEGITAETVYENTLFYCAYGGEGEAPESSAVYQLDMTKEQAQPVKIPYILEEGEHLKGITADDEGALHIVTAQYEGKNENAVLKGVFWEKIDTEGRTITSVDLTKTFQEQKDVYLSGMETDTKGNLYISIDTTVYVFDQAGNLSFQANGTGYISQLCRSREREIYVIMYGGQGMEMVLVDVVQKGFGPKHDISQLGSWAMAAPGVDGDLLLASESAVFDYDLKQKTYTEKFKWLSADVAPDYMGKMLALADGRILWLSKEYQDEGMEAELNVIRKMEKGEMAQTAKTTLVFGGVSMFIESNVRKAITEFNKTNPDYRIEIKEYGTEDLMAGITQLNGDIVNGNGPDMLALPIRFSMDLYAQKGVLEDLYPYLDRTEGSQRSDFQENILKAYETEGKLYAIPLSYDIYSVMGKSSLLGEGNAWNLDEMIAFVDSCPAGSEIFDDNSKSGVLNLCLKANTDQIVDWNASEGTFNRELLIKMLEFSERFTDDDKYTYDTDLPGKIQKERLLLLDTNVSDFGANQFMSALFGEQVAFKGYPSEKGSGSLIGSTSAIAISSNCKEKEAAWAFINSLLSEDFQESTSLRGFAIRRSSLEKQIERATEVTYYTDENGNRKEEPKGTYGMGDFMIDIYANREEDIQIIRKLIEGADKLRSMDEQITSIIMEEAASFFSNSKTAEEAVDIVENRIRTYVNETK